MSNSTVMVVYDDEKILFAFRQVLEKDGYSCVQAKTGSEAIKKFSKEHPRIVFVDMILPDISGLEVLRQIKQINQSIPVIMISSHRITRHENIAIELGACEFLSKPLSIEKVRKTLNKVISRKPNAVAKGTSMNGSAFSESKEKLLNEFERQFIRGQLIQHKGNITAASKASKMSRQNFYRLLLKHQINPNELKM